MSTLTSSKLAFLAGKFGAPIVKVFLVLPGIGIEEAIPATAFVDTGSDFSVASADVFERLKRAAANAKIDHLMAEIGDLESPYKHFTVNVAFSKRKKARSFESTLGIARAQGYSEEILNQPAAPDMLLGRDFLSQLVLFKVGELAPGAPRDGTIEIRTRT